MNSLNGCFADLQFAADVHAQVNDEASAELLRAAALAYAAEVLESVDKKGANFLQLCSAKFADRSQALDIVPKKSAVLGKIKLGKVTA